MEGRQYVFFLPLLWKSKKNLKSVACIQTKYTYKTLPVLQNTKTTSNTWNFMLRHAPSNLSEFKPFHKRQYFHFICLLN